MEHAQFAEYLKFKSHYDATMDLPIVRKLLSRIKKLQARNKELNAIVNAIPKIIKMQHTARDDNVVIKQEPGVSVIKPEPGVSVIDLTVEERPNIIYDLTEGPSETVEEEEEALEDEEEEASEAEEEAVEEEAEEEASEAEDEEAVEEEAEEDAVEEASEAAEEAEEDAVEEASEAAEDEEDEAVEEDEASEAAEDEGEVFEVQIKGKSYYVTNQTNGIIYSITSDEDVGDEVGKYADGKPIFNKK